MTAEATPGLAVVPDTGDGGSDADWAAWIAQGFVSVDHPVGTASMGRRDVGGASRVRLYSLCHSLTIFI